MAVLVLITYRNIVFVRIRAAAGPKKERPENTHRCNKKGKTGAFYAKKRLPEPTLRSFRMVPAQIRVPSWNSCVCLKSKVYSIATTSAF